MSTFENSFGSEFYPQTPNREPCFGITIPEKQFERSQNPVSNFGLANNKQKINLKEFQFQQKIVMLKIQIKLQSIIDTLQPKLLNIKKSSFQNIKQTQSPQQITAMQRNLSLQTFEEIFSRISNFAKRQKVKNLSKGFSQIILRSIWSSRIESSHKSKKKPNDKRDSLMLRVNSKIDQSSMHLSELIADGEGSQSSTLNPKHKNKQLKKQKQKIQRKHDLVLQKLEQIIIPHQQYLSKKK